MGAFNVVTTEARCPSCCQVVLVRVQFKYGATWQCEYKVGDKLTWGRNDIGIPGAASVVVDGYGESCPNCGYDGDWEFAVHLERDRITIVQRRMRE